MIFRITITDMDCIRSSEYCHWAISGFGLCFTNTFSIPCHPAARKFASFNLPKHMSENGHGLDSSSRQLFKEDIPPCKGGTRQHIDNTGHRLGALLSKTTDPRSPGQPPWGFGWDNTANTSAIGDVDIVTSLKPSIEGSRVSKVKRCVRK